ncbi:MAG TPA: hypothetical protein VNT27_04475, partial [Propionibacteriaceae bacterium]|nr:hypothetical protein [Propionibacteriaceae bacterium]
SEFEAECGCVWLMFGLADGRNVTQKISLIAVPRVPFGGRRWFFLCPQTGARACRLYLPRHGERFLSREAYGLRYTVEHDTALDSDIDRVCRLFTQISGEPPPSGALSPPPPRRKGMHRHTYDRLAWQTVCSLLKRRWLVPGYAANEGCAGWSGAEPHASGTSHAAG